MDPSMFVANLRPDKKTRRVMALLLRSLSRAHFRGATNERGLADPAHQATSLPRASQRDARTALACYYTKLASHIPLLNLSGDTTLFPPHPRFELIYRPRTGGFACICTRIRTWNICGWKNKHTTPVSLLFIFLKWYFAFYRVRLFSGFSAPEWSFQFMLMMCVYAVILEVL